MRILVCDDDEKSHSLADAIFKDTGATVEHALDAVSAEAAVRKGGYSLVLMDIDMPSFSGIKAVNWIRSMSGQASQVPIIALTSHSAAEYEQKCLAAGMNGFIEKPLRRTSLTKVINKILHTRGASAPPTR
jgi:two-component system sensor histidine kinase BarA